jgi:hypothetical protein
MLEQNIGFKIAAWVLPNRLNYGLLNGHYMEFFFISAKLRQPMGRVHWI